MWDPWRPQRRWVAQVTGCYQLPHCIWQKEYDTPPSSLHLILLYGFYSPLPSESFSCCFQLHATACKWIRVRFHRRSSLHVTQRRWHLCTCKQTGERSAATCPNYPPWKCVSEWSGWRERWGAEEPQGASWPEVLLIWVPNSWETAPLVCLMSRLSRSPAASECGCVGLSFKNALY